MLNIKSITSCNISGIPLFSSNLSTRIYEYKKYISENLNENYTFKENELCIVCIQGLYGYRCGLLGYLSNLCSYKLSQYNNPSYFQRCIKYFSKYDVKSNDYEIFSYGLSLLGRAIPLINIGNWDFKSNLFSNNKILKYSSPNYSIPNIFDLSSIYLLRPIFDSGCAIYSNRKQFDCGFEEWNILENCDLIKYKMFKTGINWSFFESDDKKSAIMIFNVNILNETPEWVTVSQFKQIIELKDYLELKFEKLNYEVYDIFILGNFGVIFNLRNVLEEVNNIYKIFQDRGLNLINECEKSNLITDTNFIFHNRYTNKDTENLLNVKAKSDYVIESDVIHNIEFEEERLKERTEEIIKEKTEEIIEKIPEETIQESINKKIENKITIHEDYEPFKIIVDSENYREVIIDVENQKENVYNNVIYRDIAYEIKKKLSTTPRSSEDEWQEI